MTTISVVISHRTSADIHQVPMNQQHEAERGGFMSQSNVGRISGEFDWRRVALFATGLVVTILTTCSHIVGAEQGSVWRADFDSALQEAEEKKLPLLIHFYAEWCMPCKRMERDVFSSPDVKSLLANRFVAVKINSDQHQDLVRRYAVETLPSDVVVDSLTGRVVSLRAGFQERNAYLTSVSNAETRFNRAHAGEIAAMKSTENGNPRQNAVVKPSAELELGDPKPVIGLDGFSPVALAKRRQWNRGSAKFAWDYKDVTYYLTTREELVEFRNNPEAYAPKLLGCDPVILWESDKAVAGDIRFGAFFDDELFLFKSEERRRQFKSNPEKYTRLQHALKANEIEKTVLR
jgi:YHS domain-containing protein